MEHGCSIEKMGWKENKFRFAESLQSLVGRGWSLVLTGGISFPCVGQEVSRAELGQGGVEGGWAGAGGGGGLGTRLGQPWHIPITASLSDFSWRCAPECSSEERWEVSPAGGKPFQAQASAPVCNTKILSPCKQVGCGPQGSHSNTALSINIALSVCLPMNHTARVPALGERTY